MPAAADVDPAIRPNFFIVGAAKSGTSTLHSWLGGHPQVFMTARKETSFFCDDLDLPGQPIRSLSAYLELFEDGRGARIRGESSVSYLLSESAPGAIAEFSPDARILISLRNPVDALVSHYSEARLWGTERRSDVNRALAPLVRIGGGGRRRNRPQLPYARVVRHADDVARYLRTFPHDRLRVVIYEEWTGQPATVLPDVLRFLGVDPIEISPLPQVRASRRLRSAAVQRLLVTPSRPASLLMRGRLGRRARAFLTSVNVSPRPATPLDPALRAELTEWLAPEVARLSDVVGRDLSAVWAQRAN